MLLPALRKHAAPAILAAAVLTSAALAAAKPQVSYKSKQAEITVTVDEAFHKHPGLFDNLLAEGRRWADEQRADVRDTLRQMPEAFEQPWTLARDYAQRSVVGRYVSVVRTDDTFTGGAHPNTGIDTILWDRDARKPVSIRPFFTETADNGPTMIAMAKLVKLAVAREKIARGAAEGDDGKPMTPEALAEQDSFINDGVKPTLLELGPVTLAPSTRAGKSAGLTFHFSPYAVGPYAEGTYTAFVPWAQFKPYLSAQGAALFAGERPEGDKKE